MKKLPSFKVAAFLTVCAVVVGGGTTLWAHGASKATEAKYEDLVKQVPEESLLKKEVTESEATVADYRQQLQHLEEAVPRMAYVPTLLTELENLGKAHSITVTGVRPVADNKVAKPSDDKKSVQGKKAYQEMLIDISGRGTFDNVMEMVDALKSFPKILAVQTVSLQPRKDANQPAGQANKTAPVLDATVRIKAYLFPDPKADTDEKSSGGQTS